MLSSLLTTACIVATLYILLRAMAAASVVNARQWAGRRLCLMGIAAFWAMAASGAVAVVAGYALGGPMLLLAVTLLILSDRRLR